MVILPLEKKLKKRMHKTIALVQDLLVMEIYDSFSSAVIHGGTAIWRCYGSNRFSEDVDFYFPPRLKKARFEDLQTSLKGKGFSILKFKKTDNSIFAKFSNLNAVVRLEVLFKGVKDFVTKDFEMSDGTSILVNTLKPEEMVKEKISAYLKRRKTRDLYDVFYLVKSVEDKEKVRDELADFLKKFRKPADEREFKALIISGSIPKPGEMLGAIQRWVR